MIREYVPSDLVSGEDAGTTVDAALAAVRSKLREGAEAAFVIEDVDEQRWQEGERVWDMVCCRANRSERSDGCVWRDYWFALEDHPEWRA